MGIAATEKAGSPVVSKLKVLREKGFSLEEMDLLNDALFAISNKEE